MTKEEVKALLTEKGIEFDGRWTLDRLKSLLPVEAPKYTEEQIAAITEDLKTTKPQLLEDITNLARRDDEGVMRTQSGIIVPDSVMMGVQRTEWEYFCKHFADYTIVARMVYNREEDVRTYSLADHGEGYKDLAMQFCEKKNNS